MMIDSRHHRRRRRSEKKKGESNRMRLSISFLRDEEETRTMLVRLLLYRLLNFIGFAFPRLFNSQIE